MRQRACVGDSAGFAVYRKPCVIAHILGVSSHLLSLKVDALPEGLLVTLTLDYPNCYPWLDLGDSRGDETGTLRFGHPVDAHIGCVHDGAHVDGDFSSKRVLIGLAAETAQEKALLANPVVYRCRGDEHSAGTTTRLVMLDEAAFVDRLEPIGNPSSLIEVRGEAWLLESVSIRESASFVFLRVNRSHSSMWMHRMSECPSVLKIENADAAAECLVSLKKDDADPFCLGFQQVHGSGFDWTATQKFLCMRQSGLDRARPLPLDIRRDRARVEVRHDGRSLRELSDMGFAD